MGLGSGLVGAATLKAGKNSDKQVELLAQLVAEQKITNALLARLLSGQGGEG